MVMRIVMMRMVTNDGDGDDEEEVEAERGFL